MAPSIKRGKIKAQVFGDVTGVIASFATKTGETLGIVTNTNNNNNNNNNVGPDGRHVDAGEGVVRNNDR